MSDAGRKLLSLSSKFVEDNEIGCAETIWQKDGMEEECRQFVQGVCEIVGFFGAAPAAIPDELEKPKSGPISPSDVGRLQEKTIPPEVFEAFNELITKGWNGTYATVKQDAVVKLIVAKMGDKLKSSEQLFENHWLDVEPIYRKSGWGVKFDKPGYNESYDAYFEFSKRKAKG